ncbi:MAG: methyltransferase domain-containing protein [Candidatus Dormibacteraeota bacterium]|nr:methyltransferase domain-containing protein [Candidatus Dormibacteraeota bacterium]
MRRTITAVPQPEQGVRHFARWVAAECPDGARVLNVGAGCNLSGELPAVRRRAAVLVGVDPDDSIADNPTLDQSHRSTVQDFAAAHEAEFDLAFSVFVLEHVSDPAGFTEACARVLKPGHAFMAMTVNLWHYFGLTSWLANRLGVADALLARVRAAEQVEEYHFPIEYRLNSITAITRHLESAGFAAVEFRCWDLPSMYQSYLPARASAFARHYNRGVYAVGSPHLMGHITFKATRA